MSRLGRTYLQKALCLAWLLLDQIDAFFAKGCALWRGCVKPAPDAWFHESWRIPCICKYVGLHLEIWFGFIDPFGRRMAPFIVSEQVWTAGVGRYNTSSQCSRERPSLDFEWVQVLKRSDVRIGLRVERKL